MKTYGVFGLGRSGKGTVDYLLARGDKVFAWDDGEQARTGIKCTDPKDWDWAEIDTLILSPGIPLTHPKPHYIVAAAKKYDTRITSDIEILWEDNKNAKFVAITGTNGKSTTTALIGHILKEAGYDVAVGGNLGTAALTLGKHKYYVIEMSSYQLDLVDRAKFDVAVWLNISADHIDRHGDIDGYIKAKMKIFKNGNETAIIGTDDEYGPSVVKSVSWAESSEFVINITRNNNLGSFPNLPGLHNMQNINAALEAAEALDVPEDVILKAIRSFPGLHHRIEFVREINGVKYVNDSKATNADSTQWALECYDDIYWIAGGVPKEGGIKSLECYFPKVTKAYLIGQAADEFAATLEGKVKYEKVGTLENAVAFAAQEAKNGVVLLSPSCASFDQFKSYEHRGDVFKKLVNGL